MTLAQGDKVVKLASDGLPLSMADEQYITYEVAELTRIFTVPAQPPDPAPGEQVQQEYYVVALLRKVD